MSAPTITVDRAELAMLDLYDALYRLQQANGALMTVEVLARFITDATAGCVCPDGPSECTRCALRQRLGLPADHLPLRVPQQPTAVTVNSASLADLGVTR